MGDVGFWITDGARRFLALASAGLFAGLVASPGSYFDADGLDGIFNFDRAGCADGCFFFAITVSDLLVGCVFWYRGFRPKSFFQENNECQPG